MMQADESQLRDEAAHKKMFQLFNGEREEKSIAIVCSINKLSVSLDRSLVGGFHLTRLEFSNQKVFFLRLQRYVNINLPSSGALCFQLFPALPTPMFLLPAPEIRN